MLSIDSLQPTADFETQYTGLTQRIGLADWSQRTLIELTGDDGATFLHNFCTNDILRLASGSGCELFVTNVKGKTVGHGVAYRGETSLVLETATNQAETLIAHLDRYVLREDVQLHDRSEEWAQLLVAGPDAGKLLADQLGIDPPAQPHDHVTLEMDGNWLAVCHTDFFGPNGYLLRSTRDSIERIADMLAPEATICGLPAIETVRIEAGTPWFGDDISEDHLPQEIARDARAISFTKGCYLGQETVARIDALGHVNRRLCGVRFAAKDVPARSTELAAEGQPVGQVTSSCYSPRLQASLALAFIRTGHDVPGTQLESPCGTAEVCELPAKG